MELGGKCVMMDALSIIIIHLTIWDPLSMETFYRRRENGSTALVFHKDI